MQFKLKDKDRASVYFPIEKEGSEYKTLEIGVNYSLGGMNYFTGNVNPRGFYLHFSPCNVIEASAGGFRSVQRTILGVGWDSGCKFLLAEAKRFNKKEFDRLLKELEPNIDFFADFYVKEENDKIMALARIAINPTK